MPTFSPAQLQDELTRRAGLPVQLFLTGNRRRMVSARRRGDAVEARVQRIFLDATPEVLDELGLLLSGRRTERKALRRFVDERFVAGAEDGAFPVARCRRMPGDGSEAFDHHDIAAYARRLNAAYLGDRSKARIVWGKRSTRRSRRSIRFGCYDPERNVVIMNRKLDSAAIPEYFVEYILFHEMLHEVLGIGEKNGRRDIHGSLFKLMESTFPDFEKARRFERELCKRLGTL